MLTIFAALTALADRRCGRCRADQQGIDINAILGPGCHPRLDAKSQPRPAAHRLRTARGQLAIIGATGYDPEGGGDENNDLAARVYDEGCQHLLAVRGYRGPKFAGLKSGAGTVVDMGREVTPSAVT